MEERWFDDAELARMSVPTMDLVIAALDDGRPELDRRRVVELLAAARS